MSKPVRKFPEQCSVTMRDKVVGLSLSLERYVLQHVYSEVKYQENDVRGQVMSSAMSLTNHQIPGKSYVRKEVVLWSLTHKLRHPVLS